MNAGDLLLRPGLLPLLALAPLLWWALRVLGRASDRRRGLLAGERPAAPGRRRGGSGLFAAGVLCAAAALLDPAFGGEAAALERRGADVVLALDVSRSMEARDVAPSRLEAARGEIGTLVRGAPGDRFGLVAFTGEARVLVPLTEDGPGLAAMADLADGLGFPTGGTDLGAALEEALRLLEAGGGGAGGAVILLTDGEDHGGRGRAAAERCRERGAAVHVLGIGTARGGKIPLAGEGGEAFLRDASGREVVTALDGESLRALAAAGGGVYAEGGRGGGAALDLHRRRILPRARAARAAGEGGGPERRFQWPLLLSLLLFTVDLCGFPARRS